MNLILHLIRKDFRHLRVLLAVWLGLAILQAVLIGSGLHTRASDMKFLFALSQFIGLLSLLKTLLLIMVVSQLVQSDSTVGSTAFWLSRPISGRKLLASKSLFLVLTVIIPVFLVEALLLLSNGVTLTDTLRSIPQIVLFQLFLTAVPMMLAALTPNLPKLFLLGIIAVVAFYLFHLTFMVFQLATPRGDSVDRGASVAFSAMIGLFLLFLVGAAIVACHQYLTRRTTFSTILALSGVPLSVLLINFWTWDLWATEHQLSKGIVDPERVTVRLEEESLKLHRFPRQPPEGVVSLRGTIALGELPAGLLAIPRWISSSLSLPNNALIRSESPGLFTFTGPRPRSSYWPLFRKEAEALGQALGGVVFLDAGDRVRPRSPSPLLETSEDLYERHRDSNGVYSADVDFLVYKHQIATIRLEKDARYDRGSDHAAILQVDARSDRLRIDLSESNHNLTLDDWKARRYVLSNPSRREALLGRTHTVSLSSPSVLPPIPQTLDVRRSLLEFVPPSGGPPIDETWLRGAALVRVETINLGRFSKTLEIKDFVMARATGS